MSLLMNLVEKGYAPDTVVRFGIRRLLKMRLKELEQHADRHKKSIIEELGSQPIAAHTKDANEQHYELPPEFFELVLGEHLKYSSALFEGGVDNLDDAEQRMLELYLQRADLKDDQEVLDLGCGWGSLSLYAAKKFPKSRITAVSNSGPQKDFIDKKAAELGLKNIKVITADMNDLQLDRQFDRITSIEMFEHMRNYQKLFEKVRSWIKADGKLFLHVFCHQDSTYYFETEGDHNWMGRYFFTGGIMPSYDLYEKVQDSFSLVEKWKVNGKNYQQTSEEWLGNMDANKEEILPILAETYGEDKVQLWFQRWRIFFAACAELFGYRGGDEWFVGHYLFKPKSTN